MTQQIFSSLKLLDVRLLDLDFRVADGNVKKGTEIDLTLGSDVRKQAQGGNPYLVILKVGVNDSDERFGESGFRMRATLAGVFELPEEGDEGAKVTLLSVNGLSLLYQTARTVFAGLGAQSSLGKFLLPTVNMAEYLSESPPSVAGMSTAMDPKPSEEEYVGGLQGPHGVLALMHEMAEQIDGSVPQGPMDIDAPFHYAHAFYGRDRRLYDAVRGLLEEGLPEEAWILTRPLFEDSVRLLQLAHSSRDDAAETLWDYVEFELGKLDGLAKESGRLGLVTAQEAARQADQIAADRGQLRDKRRETGSTAAKCRDPFLAPHKVLGEVEGCPNEWGLGGPALAALKDDLHSHLLAHRMVHSGVPSVVHMHATLDSGVSAILARTTDPRVIGGAGVFAMNSLLRAHVATGALLDWPESASVSNLYADVARLSESGAPE